MTVNVLLIVGLLINIFLVIYFRKNKIEYSKLFILGLYVFDIYLGLVFKVTGVGTFEDIILRRYTDLSINLMPFKGVSSDLFGFVANIIMFIPLGIIVPSIFKRFDKFINTFLVGFLFTFLIETSQLLNFRATDVNDLIANTLGSVIGYFIYKLMFKKLSEKVKFSINKSNFLYKYSALIFIILIFMSNFMITPIIEQLIYR